MKSEEILKDYRLAYLSRQLSVVARKEVSAGKAGFGIFGEGKELPQIIMAKNFQGGDWRSGYYRDQTFMLAVGALSPREFFAQVYADTDPLHHPHSSGRQMNNHFASTYYQDGKWLDQSSACNVAADMSCTSGQLPRLIGLGLASKLYKESPDSLFSRGGNEVAFGTIGDASTSEGHFWETVNAMGVLQIPVALCVWDDGYGISVPRHRQTTKGSLAEVLPGFASTQKRRGVDFYHVMGWDYPKLTEVYAQAITKCRQEHQPCVIHVDELTQPLGHSTSGSAHRYKSKERLAWENQFDALKCFLTWILQTGHSSQEELQRLEQEVKEEVREAKNQAFQSWQQDAQSSHDQLKTWLKELEQERAAAPSSFHPLLHQELQKSPENPHRDSGKEPTFAYNFETTEKIKHLYHTHDLIRRLSPWLENHSSHGAKKILQLSKECYEKAHRRYHTHLFCPPQSSPSYQDACYTDQSKEVHGREVIRDFFDLKLKENPRLVILGEDVGRLGGVNLEFEGLLKKYGASRVMDTGIREATILGQGHGLAMRGFRPIVDIQYLDYLIFCLQGLSDDIASLHYRTAGRQVSPTIIRTKGHRLMGIWHSGSPMAMLLGSCRGVYLGTPRNMVQACGLYNTLLAGDNPGLVIEPMNGYRLKERLPENLGLYSLPLGSVEVLEQGSHVTVVSYGSCINVALKALTTLKNWGLEVELLNLLTLMPLDLTQVISRSLKKTHGLIIMDEDVPGGASAYILQKILENQQGYRYLDTPPITLTAKEHRPPYGIDGDYYSKPQSQDLIEAVLKITKEKNLTHYQSIFQS